MGGDRQSWKLGVKGVTSNNGELQAGTAAELQAVAKEIRRLKLAEEEKKSARFHYRLVSRARDLDGPVPGREARPRGNDPIVNLAVAETLAAAARRRLASGNDTRLVTGEDIYIYNERGGLPLEVCLLVDTSGSMNGKRIREVKELAHHLVRQMHEPLSLITFQEGDVGIKVPSTRNTGKVQRGLAAMSAGGLTPLGDALRAAVAYLGSRRGKKHLLILITDGLPTWAGGDKDPYHDSLEAGKKVKKAGIRMLCIGLEPQRAFLEKLAACTGASLYIVEDLDHREIAAIARREKSRFKQEQVT